MGGEKSKYDYLLVVGPGRSGSTFLYENLKRHPAFDCREIKDGYNYRTPRRFEKIRQKMGEEMILTDLSNLAYCDPLLVRGVRALRNNGYRILIVALLREHCARAVSMIRFRKSRGEFSALFGARHLEEAVVRDRLTPAHLSDIFQLDVDVLTVHFTALTQNPTAFLNSLSNICGASVFDRLALQKVNESVRARNLLFSACGKLIARTLRGARCRRLLQRLKNSDFVNQLFFTARREEQDGPRLSAENTALLQASFRACCAVIDDASEQIGAGIYFRKASSRNQN